MIATARRFIASQLNGGPWTVYAYKPDDIEGPVSLIVDRPTLSVDAQLQSLTVPVVVVGARDGSEQSQTELDNATDAVMAALNGGDLAVVRVEPAVATVAELTYPAYRVTVACGQVACRGVQL